MELGALVEAHAVKAIVESFAVSAAIAKVRRALVNIAAAERQQGPVGFLGVFRDDVDDAIDSIRSPDGAAGTADHFNPVNVFERGILRLPPDAGVEWRVNTAAIDQHQEFV